ncbi:MAG: hypothetical protein LBB40_04400 [Holophagales bacterium]|nr:hypothetical protein [Holophagales bacterium]
MLIYSVSSLRIASNSNSRGLTPVNSLHAAISVYGMGFEPKPLLARAVCRSRNQFQIWAASMGISHSSSSFGLSPVLRSIASRCSFTVAPLRTRFSLKIAFAEVRSLSATL